MTVVSSKEMQAFQESAAFHRLSWRQRREVFRAVRKGRSVRDASLAEHAVGYARFIQSPIPRWSKVWWRHVVLREISQFLHFFVLVALFMVAVGDAVGIAVLASIGFLASLAALRRMRERRLNKAAEAERRNLCLIEHGRE